MLGNFIKGMQALIEGCRLLTRPRIRRYVAVPFLISAILFTAGLWLMTHYLEGVVNSMIPAWLDWLRYVLYPLFAVIALAMFYFGFALLASFISTPFNSMLSEAVEHEVFGTAPAAEFSWRKLLAEFGVVLISELKKLGYVLSRLIPALLLLFVPVVGAVLWFLLSAWMLALNYADYPLGNHGLAFPAQRQRLRETRWQTLGFGVAALVLTLLPVVNFIAVPAAVAGATVLYLRPPPQPPAKIDAP